MATYLLDREGTRRFMNTNLLKGYLEDPDFIRKLPFSEDEVTEPLLSVYISIRAAIRQNCPIIEASNIGIRWKQQNNASYIGKISIPINMKQYFDLVRNRDVIINSSIQLIQETDDIGVYQIL
jgi:hypothetical protein